MVLYIILPNLFSKFTSFRYLDLSIIDKIRDDNNDSLQIYKHNLVLLGLMMLTRNWQIYNIVNDLYSIYSFSDKHDTKIDKIFIKINKLDKYQSIKKDYL